MRLALRQKVMVAALTAAAGVTLTTSLAFACTSLATLSSNSSSARPGEQVEVAGRGYRGGDSESEKVSVRFDTPRGEVVATAAPDSEGAFTAAVAVPDLAPGPHVLVVTQSDGAGGTITATASLPFTVVGGAGVASTSSPAVIPSPVRTISPAPEPVGTSSGMPLLSTLTLGWLAFTAAGATALVLHAGARAASNLVPARRLPYRLA